MSLAALYLGDFAGFFAGFSIILLTNMPKPVMIHEYAAQRGISMPSGSTEAGE